MGKTYAFNFVFDTCASAAVSMGKSRLELGAVLRERNTLGEPEVAEPEVAEPEGFAWPPDAEVPASRKRSFEV